MERWIGLAKRTNIAVGVAALILFSCAPLAFVGPVLADETGDAAVSQQHQQAPAAVALTDAQATVRCWAFVAAAIATGIGSIAAGYAVANVGTAAMGAVAEKPELMGKSLIYVALAEGIAIYGLLISIIVLAKV